jgi:hypothetical protein
MVQKATRILGKQDLLSSNDLLKRELYQIPDIDAAVWMREMTAEHMIVFKNLTDKFRAEGVKNTTAEQDVEIMTTVISFSVCDENGVLLFATPDEAKGLVRNNFNLLMDLGSKALTLSKIVMKDKGLSSEVAANLPNAQTKSSLENSPLNLDEPAAKS